MTEFLGGNEKAWSYGMDCETFRECTRMYGAVFRLVKVSVTSVRLGPVYPRALSSVHYSLSSYLRLKFVTSLKLEYLVRTFMQMTLSLLLTPCKNLPVDC